MGNSDDEITQNQVIIIYVTIIIICLFFLFSSIILLIIYLKRRQWNLQMTMTSLLTFFSLLHCIITCIPVYDEHSIYCSISSSLHASSLFGMGGYPNYYFLYAYLSFEKPQWVKRYKWFFVYFLNLLIILIFISSFFLLFYLGKHKHHGTLYQCRVKDGPIRRWMFAYCGILGGLAFILLVVLIIRVSFMYHREAGGNGQIKQFIKKMILYGVALFCVLLDFTIYVIKQNNKVFGWYYCAKIVECTLGYSFLIVFGYNERISEEIKNICNKNYNRVPSDYLKYYFMKEYVKEVNLDETINES